MSEPARRIPWGFLGVCLLVLVVCSCAGATAFPHLMPGPLADLLLDERPVARQRIKTAEDAIRHEQAQPTPDTTRIRAWEEEKERARRLLD